MPKKKKDELEEVAAETSAPAEAAEETLVEAAGGEVVDSEESTEIAEVG